MSFVPPEDLHEYRIVRLLGRGAMGAVYLGRDTVLDREVAIKFIDAALPDSAARERFLVEARAIARLQHPNVAAIHRVGEYAGQPYLVTEYVPGRSLADLPLPLPPARVLLIGLDLARGLSAAHRRGVVHRDVKPANAQCNQEGAVKLVDFGIAKILGELPRGENAPIESSDDSIGLKEPPADGATLPPRSTGARPAGEVTLPPTQVAQVPAAETETRGGQTTPLVDQSIQTSGARGLTRTGALLGTPRYMAPEVWRGLEATPRSDIYSVGAVLYELACGRPPHSGATMSELRTLVTTVDAAPLSTLAPEVGPRLAEVIDRCLRRDPEARFAAGDQLALALEELGRGQAPVTGDARAASPYRGLLAFEAEHRQDFFGRAEELGAVVELLREGPLVLIAGDSGAGKSSLCRAGVLPLIEDGALGEGRRFKSVTLYPGRQPLEALRAALTPWLPELRADPALLQRPEDLSRALWARSGGGEGLIVFIDQLEELVTQSGRAEAEAVARIIAHLGARHPGLRLLMTARGDFLTRLAALPELRAVITRSLYLLGPISRAGLRNAIVGPARRGGIGFESEALVEELIASAGASDGSLPLLQFALSKLWEHRDAGRGLIPAAALAAIGGVGGALARHADGVIERLLPAEQRTARRILTSLVTPQLTRAQRAAAELATDERADAPVLEALVRGRLITARKSDEGTTFELAHEALLSGWDTLKRWLTADGERQQRQQRLEAGAAEWARLGKAPDALFRPAQLKEVASVDASQISVRAREFWAASRANARRQRTVRLAALIGLPLAIALAFAGSQVAQRLERSRAVGARLQAAEAAIGEARNKGDAVDKLRQQAFAAYGARDVARGEALFAEAMAQAEQLRAAHAGLERDIESTFLLQARTAEVRGLFARVLFDEIVASERDRPGSSRDELLQRLANFDEDGSWRQALQAPAALGVTSTPPGARVSVQRYQRDSGRLSLLPPSPPGVTPWQAALAPGSYLLTVDSPGRQPVRAPVRLGRGERLSLAIELPAANSIPPGMVYIPAGRFLYGAGEDEVYRRQVLQNVQPQHEVQTGAYLIGRREVTFGDWLEFLRALPAGERKGRLPAVRGYHGELHLEEAPPGTFRLLLRPTQQLFTLAEGERLHYPERDRRAEQDWLGFPVTGIGLPDVAAYLAWLGRSGKLPGARLCTEHEWERAARGADERLYPHGDRLEPDDANFDVTYGRRPLGFGPDEVGSHPATDSPFGVQDLAGNAWEWTTSAVAAAEVVYRGGGWYQGFSNSRSSNRELGEPTMRDLLIGFRVCAPPRSP